MNRTGAPPSHRLRLSVTVAAAVVSHHHAAVLLLLLLFKRLLHLGSLQASVPAGTSRTKLDWC